MFHEAVLLGGVDLSLSVLKHPLKYLKYKVASLSQSSKLGWSWVEDHSPMLVEYRRIMGEKRPFEGLKIAVYLPGTWECLMFMSVLEAGGAQILDYPIFCKPDVGLELLRNRSIKLVNMGNLKSSVGKADFIYDTTAFMSKVAVRDKAPVKGIVEQTASGIPIYKDFESKNLLRQPVLDLDGSHVKRVGENRLGTALGLVQALLRLNIFLPDKHVAILGFGNVGFGCAMYLKRLGCEVTVFDIDPEKTGEAEKAGYQTGKLEEILPLVDIVANATGSYEPVLKEKDLRLLKKGAILANIGGWGWDRTYFLDKRSQRVGDWVQKIWLDRDRYVYELADGFSVNFFLASGTDAETMDIVFSLGVLALEYLVSDYDSLPHRLLPIPEELQKKHLEEVGKISARKNLVNYLDG